MGAAGETMTGDEAEHQESVGEEVFSIINYTIWESDFQTFTSLEAETKQNILSKEAVLIVNNILSY